MKTLPKFISIAVVSGLISVGAATSAHADTLVPAATETAATVTVDAVVTDLSDGGQLYTYDLPDGSVMTVPYPPSDFDPLTATDEQLARYDIDPRPSDEQGLTEWQSVHSDYFRGNPPQETVEVLDNGQRMAVQYQANGIWGGWEVGTQMATSSKYVAVKGNFIVPLADGVPPLGNQPAIPCTNDFMAGAWIGLGGETSHNDLIQQGISECYLTYNGTIIYGWVPFYEFANTLKPKGLCSKLTPIPVGHEVYQNMSYQASTNTGYFYFDDLSDSSFTPLACHTTAPLANGWSFNGATAEWIMERSQTFLPDYGTIHWSNAQVQTGSDSVWHYIASQPYIKLQTGGSSTTLCQTTSNVTSNTYFDTSWVNYTC